VSGEDDNFLSRWSRRKRVAEAAPPERAADPESDAPADTAPPDPAPLTEEELAALPRIEDLVEGSDIRAFLHPGVPAALKNSALRRIWLLTPAIRDYRDPAVDYAWDWNTPGGVPGDGFGPTPERAAQMLRDLFHPPTPEAPPEQTAEQSAASEQPVPVPATADEPGGQAADAVQDAIQPADEQHESELAELPASPRRRHGGALPS